MSQITENIVVPLMKVCVKCQASKPTSDFYPRTNHKSVQTYCKQCYRDKNREFYLQNYKSRHGSRTDPKKINNSIKTDYANGMSAKDIASKYNVHINTIYNWKKRNLLARNNLAAAVDMALAV